MNPLILAAGVVAGQYLVEANGGWTALLGLVKNSAAAASSGQQAPLPTVSAPGNNAAVAYLAGLGSVAGIAVTIDPQSPSVTAVWTAMQPQISTTTDGKALATAFLGAFDAARNADPATYTILAPDAQGNLNDPFNPSAVLTALTPCSSLDTSQMSSLGQAACALSADRDGYGTGDALLAAFGISTGTVDNTQIITDIATLASEMDAVGYTTQQAGTIDNIQASINFSVANLNKTISSATQTGLNAIGSAAGAALGGAASALVGSNVLWAAAFGVIAWKVLT